MHCPFIRLRVNCRCERVRCRIGCGARRRGSFGDFGACQRVGACRLRHPVSTPLDWPRQEICPAARLRWNLQGNASGSNWNLFGSEGSGAQTRSVSQPLLVDCMCTKGHLRCREAVPQAVETIRIVSLFLSLQLTYAIKFEDRQAPFLFGILLIYHYNSIIERDDVLTSRNQHHSNRSQTKFGPSRISTPKA